MKYQCVKPSTWHAYIKYQCRDLKLNDIINVLCHTLHNFLEIEQSQWSPVWWNRY